MLIVLFTPMVLPPWEVGGSLNVARREAGKMLVAPCWKSQVRDPGLIQTSFTKADNNVLMRH